MRECGCIHLHTPRLVVITGGPGAGKTAVLDVAKRHLCPHVRTLPEAASLLYSGGFPRDGSAIERRGGQRAIYHVQRELERMAIEKQDAGLILCDRGTVDGAAYWPGEVDELWNEVHSSLAAELARYHAVIHLRTPSRSAGYGHSNPLRIESADEARLLDQQLLHAWEGHPRVKVVENHVDFMRKVTRTLELIEALVPECCRKG